MVGENRKEPETFSFLVLYDTNELTGNCQKNSTSSDVNTVQEVYNQTLFEQCIFPHIIIIYLIYLLLAGIIIFINYVSEDNYLSRKYNLNGIFVHPCSFKY